MLNLDKTIKPIEQYNGLLTAGIGYVVIPKDVDRDSYVSDCLRTNTVSIYGGVHYSYFHNVSVETEVIQRINFPNSNGKHGSPVIWIKIPIFNKPVIVGILKYENDYYSIDEKSRNQSIIANDNVIDVSKRALEATYDITVKGNSDTPGEFNIVLQNINHQSKLNINIQGEYFLHASKGINLISDNTFNIKIIDELNDDKLSIYYNIGEGFQYKDEFNNNINFNKNGVEIISEKIKHNNGDQPMVLGDNLENILKDLIDEINKIQVSTAFGPSSTPLNFEKFELIKNQLSNIKSNKSFLE